MNDSLSSNKYKISAVFFFVIKHTGSIESNQDLTNVTSVIPRYSGALKCISARDGTKVVRAINHIV